MSNIKKDLNKQLAPASTLVPAVRTASANGTGVDLAGYTKAMVLLEVGVIVDGTFAPTVEESDDNATFTAVAAGNLSSAFVNAVSSTPQKVGYLGTKRYIRGVLTVTGAPATGAPISMIVVRGGALTEPQ